MMTCASHALLLLGSEYVSSPTEVGPFRQISKPPLLCESCSGIGDLARGSSFGLSQYCASDASERALRCISINAVAKTPSDCRQSLDDTIEKITVAVTHECLRISSRLHADAFWSAEVRLRAPARRSARGA